MKKFLATTAIASMAFTGAASAQSVLERVLAQTQSLGEVTGVFANVADNIGSPGVITVYESSDAIISEADYLQVLADAEAARSAQLTIVPVFSATTGEITHYIVADTTGGTDTPRTLQQAEDFIASEVLSARTGAANPYTPTTLAGGSVGSIDGSITNVARRIDQATANVDNQVTSISNVTTNFGSMATTVLGAVNTGEIGLGTNQVVEEALSGTSEAIRSVVNQVGTTAGQTVLALNSALNTMNIDGSISNTFEGVNASVATISPDQLNILSADGILTLSGLDDLLGSMDTTVLGAVNTGTIVSGVNNQVAGTVAGIVGNSATNMFAAAPAPTAPAPAPTE